MDGETYYEVLGVPRDADRAGIEDAYRERVKETHPDVSDDPDAEAFRRVTRARDVLADPDERERYDRLGHDQYVRIDSVLEPPGEDDVRPGTDPRARTDERSDADAPGNGNADRAGGTDGSETTADADARRQGAAPGGRGGTGGATGAGGSAREGTGRGAAAGRSSGESAGRTGNTGGTGTSGGTRGSTGASATDSGAYATRSTYADRSVDRLRVPLNPRSVIQLGTLFVLYPVFLFASVLPAFPFVVNVVVGLCTLFFVAYLLSIPGIAVVVFGTWSLLMPALLSAVPGLEPVSPIGMLALLACVFPFGMSVLTRSLLRA